MRISDLRRVGDNWKREGVSIMALECVAQCDGSYKGVMKLCGELSVLAKMSTFDEYWNEQVHKGIYRMNEVCKFKLEQIKEVI